MKTKQPHPSTYITDHLDTWSSAIKAKSSAGRGGGKKQEFYGIKKLRELILELAVRGLLVEQESSEEPAADLLKEYARAKAKLIKDGEIKKPKPVPRLERNARFAFPAGWSGAQLTDIALVDMGNSPPGSTYNDTGDGVPLINGPVEFSRGHFGKTIKAKYTTAPNVLCDERDILVCVRGATTGRTNIADFPACIGRGVARVKALGYQEYVNLLMWENQYKLLAKGTGTTFPSISYKDLAGHNLSLPPLAEQHRIVAKVDELMALCDQLEQQQEDSARTHGTLVGTLLGALTTASESGQFEEAWKRIEANFDTLFTTESSIDQLKQTILQLAVMGKLVEQDPGDEPADKLLKRILAERRMLERTKATVCQEISPEGGLGYDIPESWQWQLLDDLLVAGPTNGFSPKAVSYETPVRSLTLSATTSGRFNGGHSKFITTEVEPESDLWLCDGDILVQRGNTIEYVGVAAVYRGEPNSFVYPDLMMKLRVSKALDIDFIHLAMSEVFARDFLRDRASGTSGSMPKINQKTLKSLPLPIPPLTEQHRIVAKVDELMTLCNCLKATLQTAQSTQLNLANSLVESAIN